MGETATLTDLDLDRGLRRLGYDAFRPGQREAVEALLATGRLLLVAPTGGGKSLAYQLPAVLLPGTTVVISPLVALMNDYRAGKQLDLEFVDGVATVAAADAEAFRFFFAAERPVVTVQTLDQKIAGTSEPIEVRPAPLLRLGARLARAYVRKQTVAPFGVIETIPAGTMLDTITIDSSGSLWLEALGYESFGPEAVLNVA